MRLKLRYRLGHNIGHHARALTAAKDQQTESAVRFRPLERRCCGCDNGGPYRIAGTGGLGRELWIMIGDTGKSGRDRGNAASEKLVGPAHDAVLFMNERRDIAQ